MTWTDEHGVTHLMRKLTSTQKDIFYKPVVEARKRAMAEQERLRQLFAAEGVEVKPLEIEEPWEPDCVTACAPLVWASLNHLDLPPRPVTCINCLAAL